MNKVWPSYFVKAATCDSDCISELGSSFVFPFSLPESWFTEFDSGYETSHLRGFHNFRLLNQLYAGPGTLPILRTVTSSRQIWNYAVSPHHSLFYLYSRPIEQERMALTVGLSKLKLNEGSCPILHLKTWQNQKSKPNSLYRRTLDM